MWWVVRLALGLLLAEALPWGLAAVLWRFGVEAGLGLALWWVVRLALGLLLAEALPWGLAAVLWRFGVVVRALWVGV